MEGRVKGAVRVSNMRLMQGDKRREGEGGGQEERDRLTLTFDGWDQGAACKVLQKSAARDGRWSLGRSGSTVRAHDTKVIGKVSRGGRSRVGIMEAGVSSS
jgi:hypothetical protein